MSPRSSKPRGLAALASLGALATAALVVAGCAERPRVPRPPVVAGAQIAAAGSPAASGLRAYRDPVTGAFVQPPQAPGLAPQRAAPAQTAGPIGFTETAAPGGGTMIQLGGAFHSDLVAKRGAASAEVSCAPVRR